MKSGSGNLSKREPGSPGELHNLANSSVLRPEFVQELRCPADGSPLHVVSAEWLARLNAEVAAGRIRNQGGELRREPYLSGLLAATGSRFYPLLLGNVPDLLLDSAVDVRRLRET